jgi:Rod binding domain-containing protein
MAITITSDLVLDVLRAAPPQKLAAAQRKLAPAGALASADPAAAAGSTADVQKAARAKANQQFEAAMLRNFTEQMLPREASSLYGEGTAGNIWRSLQVDLMSQELAKSGGIGIAKMLDRIGETEQRTAETLGLNEMLGSARQGTSLSSAAEWPYFSSAGEDRG